MAYKNMEKSVFRENTPYLTSTFRKLALVVLNIYNTIHNFNKEIGNHHRKSGHIGTPNPNEYMGCVSQPKNAELNLNVRILFFNFNQSLTSDLVETRDVNNISLLM